MNVSFAFFLAAVLVQAANAQAGATATEKRKFDPATYLSVSYCDMTRNPEVYDGKRVAVVASYRYGFEWQELFCLRCRSDRTWLKLPSEPFRPIKLPSPRYQGTINGTFYGTFIGKRGSYGDGGYRYLFDLEFLRKEKLISKSGADPRALPPEVQVRLCQGDPDPATILADPPVILGPARKTRK